MIRLYSAIGFIVFWGIILLAAIGFVFWCASKWEDRQKRKMYERELNGRRYDGEGKV